MGMFDDVLLTVDYDQTLTSRDSSIPQRNLEAIRYFMENGGAFTVNTGRSIPMAQSIIKKVPVNAPLLLYNGSAAYDLETNHLCFCHNIQLDLWETICKCHELFPDLTVEVQGVDAHYIFEENPMWVAFCNHQPCANRIVPLGSNIGAFIKFTIYGQLRDISVTDLFKASKEELAQMDKVEKILNEQFGQYCEVFRSADRIIDVHAKGVSKNRSARELQQRLGRKYLVCVGDAHNDISMLDGADFSFVPCDATLNDRYPNVCSCDEGAVADVIYKKIPEILKNAP